MKTLRFCVFVFVLSVAVSMSAQLVFYGVAPCRVADTRNATGPLGGPSLAAMQQRDFPIQSACAIPSTAAAYSLNLTVVPHGTLGYLSIWPTGLNQPVVSTLNSFQGFIIANAAIVPAGSNGQVSVFVSNDTDLIIDIDGYFAMPNGGLQSVNHGQSTVTISQNTTYTFTVNWVSPFADTNYTVTCTPQLASGTQTAVYLFQVSAVNPSSVSLQVAAVGPFPADLIINCIGVHN